MKVAYFMILLLLTGCSVINPNNPKFGYVKFTSNQDLNFNFQNRDYQLKSGVIEEVTNVLNQTNYTVMAWSSDTYKTKNICYFNKTCFLKADTMGKATINKINENSFSIDFEGDVRNPIFCIAYKDIVWKGINAIEVSIPPEYITKEDHCYLAEQSKLYVVKEINPVVDVINPMKYSMCSFNKEGQIYLNYDQKFNHTDCYMGNQYKTYIYDFSPEKTNYLINITINFK